MSEVNINNHDNTTELFESKPYLFKGLKGPRDILKVEKYSIAKQDIFYAYLNKDDKYISSKDSYSRAILFIKKDVINEIINKFYSDDILYPTIKLADHEKFRIEDDTYRVRVRGERKYDKIYFYVKDIGKMLGVVDLRNDIVRENSCYTLDIDYIFISVKFKGGKYNKAAFFTLTGLYRYIFSSRKEAAINIQESVCKILYVKQFGSIKERKQLADKVLGTSTGEVKNVMKSCTDQVSCIYLFTLGYAKDLRDFVGDDFEDDEIICKYGFTNDLARRTKEHEKTFGKINKATLRLKYHTYVDNEYLSKAETVLSRYFDDIGCKLEFSDEDDIKRYKELIYVSKKYLNRNIKDQFESIGQKFCIKNKELVDKLKYLTIDYERKLEKMKYETENKLLKKDTENKLLKKDTEILKKDLEIMKLRLQLAEKK